MPSAKPARHPLLVLPCAAALVGAAFVALVVGCGSTGGRVRAGEAVELWSRDPHRITPIDHLESGRRQVRAFVVAQEGGGVGAALEQVLATRAGTCVRVEARSGESLTHFSAQLGSGVLLGGGLVLTAGHTLEGLADVRFRVFAADGRIRDAHLVAAGGVGSAEAGDWALLALDDPGLDLEQPIELGQARRGELCVVLGYPSGNAGIGADGNVVLRLAHDARPLAPLAAILEVRRRAPLELQPIAGLLPPQGMSGSPLYDLDGRLVGILASVSMSISGSTMSYTAEATPAGVVRDRLGGDGTPARARRARAHTPTTRRSFLTDIDYLESGARALLAYVDEQELRGEGGDLRGALERAQRATVRVRSRSARDRSGGHTSRNSSGVLLAGGRFVLAAGHAVSAKDDVDLHVILPDGRELAARLVEWEYASLSRDSLDWALLELVEPAGMEGVELATGAPPAGSTLLVLGFSGNLGLDDRDRIVAPGDRSRTRLRALACVATPAEADELELIAGALPLDGASGGPIFDAEGRVWALFTGVAMSDHEQAGVRFRITTMPLARLGQRLEALTAR